MSERNMTEDSRGIPVIELEEGGEVIFVGESPEADEQDNKVSYEIRVINLDESTDMFGNVVLEADEDENFILTLDGRRVVFVRVQD